MIKFIRILKKTIGMSVSREMAYKWNFYLKALACALSDFVGPLLTLLIYSASEGIPGWGFYEFLLFQGTLTLVFGLGHAFVMMMPYEIMQAVRMGEFDKYLVKPFNTLLYSLATSFDMEGLAEVAVGIIIVAFSMFKLGISIFSFNFLAFIVLIIAGFLVQAAAMTLVSALSFIVVNSDALVQLYFKISDFVRYPLNVYNFGIRFFLTFLFPLAISSFYPSIVLLQGATPKVMLTALLPITAFVIASLILWNKAMKNYTSAGG
ncbi:MAG: ABC-2 family transporter protein [Candidatus Woesearchaeota archaeon]